MIAIRIFQGYMGSLIFSVKNKRMGAGTDLETFRAFVEHTITRFKHVIDANGMHIEQTCE